MQQHDTLARFSDRLRMPEGSAVPRAAAVLLLVLVFWLDRFTPVGFGVPSLYVLPVLVCIWARSRTDPLVVAAVTTVLAVAGSFISPPGGSLRIEVVNRTAEIVVIWTAAGVIVAYRRMKERWAGEAEEAASAMADTLKGLDEIRYAIDQAAIVATTDQRGVITYVNDKFCEISKYSRAELIGQDHRIINSGYHSKEFIRDLWRTIAQGRIWRGELRNRAKNGSIYWVDTTIVPFLDGQGKPRQYMAIRSDITQRKAAEAKLREQAALTHLGQLAAVVAHEVRNPLAGVRASLQVLDGRVAADARAREVIAAMIQRIDELNETVDDLLLYARPKAPRLQVVDVRAVAQDAASSARASVGAACPLIDISGESARAQADPEMLRAALLNLTMNACQASESKPVEITLTAGAGTCRIAVRDRGPGIPADVRDRVFEPFFTTRAGGTGLGLAVVKRLMELQGGSVSIESRPGGGTVAELSIPLARG
jgi:PAS domain S-box-containing protein